MHLDLVVPREGVQETQHLAAGRAIYQGVDAGQRVRVLRARLIQVREVHAYPPFSVRLFHQDDVGKPLRVLNLPDVASNQQLLRFVFHHLLSFLIELSPSLAHGADCGVHAEVLTQEIGVDAGHIRGGPCEGIQVA